MHVAAARAVHGRLLPALRTMHGRLTDQAKRWDEIVKIGRTHLQDATPLTLGQEFSGYAVQLADCIERIEGVLPRVMKLAQGGTAVGTGLNAPPGFAVRVRARNIKADPVAVRVSAQQIRRNGCSRHDGRAVGRPQRNRRCAKQDRQ